MTLRFAVCPGCKLSMTLPDDYVSFSPWLAAHGKVCPGEGKIRVIAKVRRPRKLKTGEPVESVLTPEPDFKDFVAEVGSKVAKSVLTDMVETFFKGRVK